MTIPNENYKNIYTGNDVASVFQYTFKIFKNIDIEVTEILISTGAETLLILTTDYTVSGVGETSGNVTLVAGALPSTKKLVINLKPELLQETDYKEHDPFPAETHEKALDKIVNQVKSQQEVLDRLVQRPITETDPLIIPTLINAKFLSNDGVNLLWSTLTSTTYNGTMTAGLDASKPVNPLVNDIYIATDTKRIYVCFAIGVWSVTNHFYGLDANKAASPIVGEIYIATDTRLVYVCLVAASWTLFNGSGVNEDMKNLVVVLNSGTPATEVDIDADVLQVEEYNLAVINRTIDATGTGADGLDAGVLANNTWYSAWVIYDPVLNLVAGLLSTSETAPTMPTGYTKKRKVGHVRTGGAASFNDNGNIAESFGDKYHYRGDVSGFDFSIGDLTLDGAWHDLDLSNIVPDGTKAVELWFRAADDIINSTFDLVRNGDTNKINRASAMIQVANVYTHHNLIVACDSGRIVEYRATNTTWLEISIIVKGWWR